MSGINLATVQAMQAEIERLKAENAKLQTEANKPVRATFKITDKGGMSVYGLGRFPVTLYKSQWEKLLSQADQIREFMAQNADKLSDKPKAQVETASDHVA